MAEQLFSVQYGIPLNLEFLGNDFELPEAEDFAKQKPEVFKLCGALPHLDFKTVRSIKEDGPEYADLAAAVDRQSDKINQILSFLISVYDEKFNLFETYEFSGNGFSFICPKSHKVAVGDLIRARIYLLENSAAVFCYVQVTADEALPDNSEAMLLKTQFVRIEDEDRELMIAATFNAQRRDLKLRARKNKPSTNSSGDGSSNSEL